MAEINFYSIDGNEQPQDEDLTKWLEKASNNLPVKIASISIVLCNDLSLLEINKTYLNHDYYTDIITFDLRDNQDEDLFADLYISTERVEENAKQLDIDYKTEFKRVIIHGILHLCGYSDKSPEEKLLMVEQENQYLKL